MNNAAVRLVWRLIVLQIVTGALTTLVVVAFAPRLLLLDASVVEGSASLVTWGTTFLFAFVIVATLVVTRPLRPTLRALAVGSTAVEPDAILDLYAIPARLVTVDVGVTSVTQNQSTSVPLSQWCTAKKKSQIMRMDLKRWQ